MTKTRHPGKATCADVASCWVPLSTTEVAGAGHRHDQRGG